MEIHGALAFSVCLLVVVSCIYASAIIMASIIDFLKDYFGEQKEK